MITYRCSYIIILNTTMPSKAILKTVNKVYPPQVSQSDHQLYLYCPLEHWIEVYSGTSLADVLQIEGPSHPLFMNRSADEIVLQDQHSLWIKKDQGDVSGGFERQWTSQQRIVSSTIKLNNAFVNVTQNGQINCWKTHNQGDCNPESSKVFITKNATNEDAEETSTIFETHLDVESMFKKYHSGYNLVELSRCKDSLLTLHSFEEGGQTWTRICSTDLEDDCESSFYRGILPSTVNSFTSQNNSILAFGGQGLFLLDSRSESIVTTLNDLPDSSINSVQLHPQRPELLTICRNNTILQQDLRYPGQTVEVVLTIDEDIDRFEEISSVQQDMLVVSGKFSGKIAFYSKREDI